MKVNNMKIGEGIQNWERGFEGDRLMTSGALEVKLENGASIHIEAVATKDGYYHAAIKIFNMNDTDLTIFEKGSNLSKQTKSRKDTVWTDIKMKEA
tara:strand:+ start:105 stop:392 length:288 start_codon:yes stop_codon:yes gene_type:complete